MSILRVLVLMLNEKASTLQAGREGIIFRFLAATAWPLWKSPMVSFTGTEGYMCGAMEASCILTFT